MSFASFEFALFAPFFFALYALFGWRVPVYFILGTSLLFYAWWDISFLPLLLVSATIDYFAAIKIHDGQSDRGRKAWMAASVIGNICLLVYFKYVGPSFHDDTYWAYVLPLGISFYTLQTLGYTTDVYRRKFVPERSYPTYLLYVSFFPQLVAGPIERAHKLLPQLNNFPRFSINAFRMGMVLVCWGLFMKLAVADNLRPVVNQIFSDPNSGYWGWMAMSVGWIQVYTDFYAYTLIARGLAKAIGINLSENFRQPFFAKNLTGFWQRWHITLTRWIIDYVHIPIARKFPNEPFRSLVAILAFLLIGAWHGATANFLLFGLMHGVGMRLWGPTTAMIRKIPHTPWFGRVFSHGALMLFLMLSGPLFMITELGQLYAIYVGALSFEGGSFALPDVTTGHHFLFGLVLSSLVILNDILIRSDHSFDVERVAERRPVLSLIYLMTFITLTLFLGNLDASQFIYFQF